MGLHPYEILRPFMQHKEELKAFRICLLPILSDLKLSMSNVSFAVRTFLICPSMCIFCSQDAPHPFLLILALSAWRWFYLLVKGTGCHNFLHVLHLPSHLRSHYSRFVLCYSTSASPSQVFAVSNRSSSIIVIFVSHLKLFC